MWTFWNTSLTRIIHHSLSLFRTLCCSCILLFNLSHETSKTMNSIHRPLKLSYRNLPCKMRFWVSGHLPCTSSKSYCRNGPQANIHHSNDANRIFTPAWLQKSSVLHFISLSSFTLETLLQLNKKPWSKILRRVENH